MAYRLEQEERTRRAVRRIAGEVIDAAIRAAGTGATAGDEGEERVHEARTSLKRARALLRLIRPAIGDDVFRRENEALRGAGRSLGGVRDTAVLVRALDDLLERTGEEAVREPRIADVRTSLQYRRAAAAVRGPAFHDVRAALLRRRDSMVARGWDAAALRAQL